MLDTFIKVLPVFFIICTGFMLKRTIITNNSFWEISDKLTYYVLFPALLIVKLSHADFTNLDFSYGIISVVIATTVVALLMLLLKCLFKLPDKEFTSFFQGGVRYNSYIFIAMSLSLYGDGGVAIASVFIAYMIIFTNIITVVIMSIYGQSNKTIKSVIISIIKNPLIMAAFFGVFISYLGIKIPYVLEEFLTYIGNAALPLSLMSIGAGLIFISSIKKALLIGSSVGMKLVILPISAVLFLNTFSVSGMAFSIAVLYASVPCAGNAYILARQMGGDAESMAAIITLTTLFSIITIPIVISFSFSF